jgi:hypothetical protein
MNDRSGESYAVKEKNREQAPFHMMWFVGQFFLIPVATFIYGVELLVKTLQGMQEATTQGMSAVVGSAPQTTASESGPAEIEVGLSQTGPVNTQESGATSTDVIEKKEENTLSNDGNGIGLDKDLHDDMLKLVRYKILFVKREYEHAFPENEDLVSDNMDGASFAAWKVAEFIQQLAKEKTDVPTKWVDRYPSEDRDTYVKDGKLIAFPDHDKKYLRVYYEVLDRYPREKFKYEEQQIEVLKEIRNELRK